MARKAESEVENYKITENERRIKEETTNKLALEKLQMQNRIEKDQLTKKYEGSIKRDRLAADNLNNKILIKLFCCIGDFCNAIDKNAPPLYNPTKKI